MSETHTFGGKSVTIRPPGPVDVVALARFAKAVPPHDLLFLARDIREPKVLGAWLKAQASGELASLIALDRDEIVATVAALSDRLSWSPHVWDLRLLVAPGLRGKGLGRHLLDAAITAAARLSAPQTACMSASRWLSLSSSPGLGRGL